MKKHMICFVGFLFLAAAPAFAQDATPTKLNDRRPNMMKMEGTSPTIDGLVNYGRNFFQAARRDDGLYDVIIRFDPMAVETLVPEMNEDIRTGQFRYGTVKVWLGNLQDKKQRKDMPEGEVDLANKRVTFRGVKFSGIERVNLPVKFYDDQGKEIKIPNDTGGPLGKGFAWGWIPSGQVGTPASVEGTPHNGWRFEVMPDGSLEPRGLKGAPIP